MRGTARVTATGALSESVTILDDAPQGPRFAPLEVTIGRGATVTWTHGGNQPHTVTDLGGAGLSSRGINGRVFVGNTPTIVAESGRRIRWYVFNLDLGELWHNFHVHGARWRVGQEIVDTRSIGPAESFVVETVVPDVILPPLEGQYMPSGSHHAPSGGPHSHGSEPGHSHGSEPGHLHGSEPGHSHGPGSHSEHPHEPPSQSYDPPDYEERPSDYDDHPPYGGPKKVRLRGDFLVHCHVEMHMMEA